MKGNKFHIILETTTKNGKKVMLKLKVPPSKHLGLINFLKIGLENGDDINFAVEKVSSEKRDLSRAKGSFRLKEDLKENPPKAGDKV